MKNTVNRYLQAVWRQAVEHAREEEEEKEVAVVVIEAAKVVARAKEVVGQEARRVDPTATILPTMTAAALVESPARKTARPRASVHCGLRPEV